MLLREPRARGGPAGRSPASRRCAAHVQAPRQGIAAVGPASPGAAAASPSRLRGQFGRGGRRRRAQVGAEVGDGDVGLVADAAHDGHWAARRSRARALVVEGPQVLDRAAAAHQQDHVDRAALGQARTATRSAATSSAGACGALHRRRSEAPPARAARAGAARSPRRAAPQRQARSRRRCRAAANGSGRLRAASNKPLGLEPGLQPQETVRTGALARRGVRLSTTSCSSPRGS